MWRRPVWFPLSRNAAWRTHFSCPREGARRLSSAAAAAPETAPPGNNTTPPQGDATNNGPSTTNVGAYPVFRAEPRDEALSGTRHSQRLRLANRIPAVLYGVSDDGSERERRLLTVCHWDLRKEIRRRMEAIENTLYEVEVEGHRSLALPRQIQIRAGQLNLLNVNFVRFKRGMTVDFPLRFVDEEINAYLKRTGYLHHVKDSLKCVVDTFDLPEFLDVSVAKGGKQTVFTMDDVKLPPGLRVAPNAGRNRVIAVIKGR